MIYERGKNLRKWLTKEAVGLAEMWHKQGTDGGEDAYDFSAI